MTPFATGGYIEWERVSGAGGRGPDGRRRAGRDRRRTQRGEAVRWFNPNPKLLAGSGLAILLTAALGTYTASRTGYAGIGRGFFLTGLGWAAQFLITCRKP